MTTKEDIQLFVNEIAREFSPERIILFGSHAYGSPTLGSDVDLLVEMSVSGDPIEKTVEIIRTLHPMLDADIIVREPGYLERRAAMGDVIMKEVLHKGITLYARGN